MNPVVIDTNCLLQIIARKSPYRPIWDAFLKGRYELCTRLIEKACVIHHTKNFIRRRGPCEGLGGCCFRRMKQYNKNVYNEKFD